MSIKRYPATSDNTITNAYKTDLKTRATGSNMGASDILEVFHIHGQASSASSENSRALVQFPIDTISDDRGAGTIPDSGSVDFFLRLYNAKHSQTLPKNFELVVSAISEGWEEGSGLDMEGYTDLSYDQTGSNWTTRLGSTNWTTQGGSYLTDVSSSFTASFAAGTEDMELNITTLVEQWIDSAGNVLGSKTNNGLGIRLTATAESASVSYYTKKFFGRGTEFFFKRPSIEARWDSTKKDNRGNFQYSSSLSPATGNLNNLYMYNVVRGQLRDIPTVGTGKILVSLYSGTLANTAPSGSRLGLSFGGDVPVDKAHCATGSWVSTGIYSASLAFTGSSGVTKIYDVWHSGNIEFHTGSITPETLAASSVSPNPTYFTKITNLKSEYSTRESSARFRVFVRDHDWSPTIYTVASTDVENKVVDNAYFKVYRVVDELQVIPYATGSAGDPQVVGSTESYTRLSYDDDGNYFDLDIGMLEPGYSYGIQFLYHYNESYREQPEIFKFRVK